MLHRCIIFYYITYNMISSTPGLFGPVGVFFCFSVSVSNKIEDSPSQAAGNFRSARKKTFGSSAYPRSKPGAGPAASRGNALAVRLICRILSSALRNRNRTKKKTSWWRHRLFSKAGGEMRNGTRAILFLVPSVPLGARSNAGHRFPQTAGSKRAENDPESISIGEEK